jgi:hypothetical protein
VRVTPLVCIWANKLFIFHWQVEIQARKIYCINRAIPTLPINLEDAARSEAEFQKAEQVSPFLCLPFVFKSVPQHFIFPA